MGSKCCKCGSDKNIQHHHLQSTSQSSSALSSSYRYPRSRVWEEVGGGMEEEWARADGPPLLARRLADQAVKVGTRTRLLTEIASSSPLTVIWLHDGKKVEESDRLKLVNEGNFYCCDISPVILEDEGIWSCQGHNARGLVSSQAKLTLVVPRAYKKPEFVEEVRAVVGAQGTVSLQTKVTGVPGPSLRWFKEGVEIRAGDVLGLTLDPGDPSLGTYTCLAANCMGTAVSSSRVHVVSPQLQSQPAIDQPQTTEQISFNTTGPKPIFAKELRNEKMKIGGTLVLECEVKVPPWPDRVSWYNSLGEVKESPRAHLMEDGLGGFSVRVSPVEAADDGSWRFVATNRGGATSVTSSSVSISFPKNYRKPKFLDPLKAVLTEEGLVSFECKVVGYPTPQLSWFKDGQELKPGDVYQLTGTNSLGSYCCIARNCMGEAESTAVLTVEDIQSQLTEEERLQLFTDKLPPKFIQGLKSMEAKISEPFTFTVKVSISPEPTMLWFRDDEHVDETESRYKLDRDKLGLCSLHIAKLEFADQAEWKCVAMNDYGQSVTSSYLKLNIPRHYKKPKFLEELRAVLSDEGAVNLECKVIGVPQPVLKWFKDGKELKPGDIHRIISGQDGSCCLGTYTCVAQNCMGTVSSSASLLGFQDKPMVAAQKSTTKSPPCVRDTSLSTIQEERTSQLHTLDTDRSLTLDDRPEEVSFSFDGREVSVSLYETPDLTEEEALQIVEMYADQISEHVSEHNVVELPPMRFTKESSTSGKMLMEALVIDVSPDYFTPGGEDDLRTDADLEEFSFIEEALTTPDDEKAEIDFSPFRVKQITEDEGSQYADAEDKSLSQQNRTVEEPKRKKKKSIDSEKEDDSLQEFERRKTEKRSSKERRRTESEMEDDSLYEFESRKAIEKKLEQAKEIDVKVETVALVETEDSGEMVSVFKTAELATLRESKPSVTEDERAYDTAEELAFDKSEISVLESLAHSLHDIQRGLARVEAHVISEGQEIKSPEVSVLESLAQPIADVQRSLELMEEKIDEGLIGSQVLETLVQPISEFKKNLKMMEEESVSSSTTSLQRRTSSIMESLTKPLKDLEREISLIQEQYYPERGISEEKYAKSVEEVQETLTRIIERQESVPHDRKIMKTISTELQELEETANDDLEKYYDRLLACSTEMRKKLNNEQDQEIIDILRCVGDFVKPLKHLTGVTSKCITVIVKDYETGGIPSAKLVESLVKPLEALRSTLDLLESVSSLKSHRAIRGAGIALLYKLSVPMDELDTTIKLVENLSAHTAVEFLVTPLDNLVKVVSSIDISSGGEGFLENLPEEGSHIIKKLDNSLGVMVNSVNSVKNNLNNVEMERDLIEKLPSIMKPMEELQRSLKPIVEIVNEDVSYDDVCEIAQTLSKPLQTLRSELSIMQHEIEIEQYGDISGEKRSVLSELIEPLESVQTSINSFHESVLCKEDPIHLRFVLYALKEMLNPFNTLCSKMRTAEKAIIEGRVMDPYQGLKNVAKSVKELREMSSLTKTDLPVLHRISAIMYEPLEIVETGLMDVLDEIRETSQEKLNSTLLKTLDEPLKMLQRALLEIQEEVHLSKDDSPELNQTLKDLQRSVLLIQDHASFECGDEPSSLESNIMILESLTQPLQTMRTHMSEIQRSSVRNLIRVDRALTDIKNSAGSIVSAVAGTEEGPLACVLQSVAQTLSELGEAAESQNIQIGQGQSMEIARRNVSDLLTDIASSLGDICAQADDISGEFEGESRAALVLIQDLVHDLKSAMECTVQVMNEKKTSLEQASVTVTALENLNKSIFSFQNSLTNIDEVVLKMPRKSISMDELKDFVEQLEKDVNLVVDKISIFDTKKPPQLLDTIVKDVSCVRNLVVNMAKYDNVDEVLETVKCIEKNLQTLSRDTLKEECIQLNEACKTAQAIVSMQEQLKPVTKEELERTHSEIIETLIESVKSLESVIEKIRILPTVDPETEKAMYLITHHLVELEENIIALTFEDEIESFSQKLNNIARPLKMIEENLHHVNANIDDVREAEIVMNQMSHVLFNTTEKEISQKSDFEKLFSSESLSLAIDAPLIKGIATTVESMQCYIKPLMSKESNKLVWFLDSFEESLLKFSRNLAESISDIGNEAVKESLTAQIEEMKNELCTADITNEEKSTSLKSALVLLEESLKKEEGSHKILPALQALMKPLKALHADVFRVDNLALKVAEKKYVEDFSKASHELAEGLINFEKTLEAKEPLNIQQLTKSLEILTGYVESLNNDVLFEEVHEKSNIVKLKGLTSHIAEIRTLVSPLEGVMLEDRVKVEEMLQAVAGSVSDLRQNVASIEEQVLHQSYSTELLDLKEAVSVVCSHLEEEESLGTLVGPANVLKETLEAISMGKSEPACIVASVNELKTALEVIEQNEMTQTESSVAAAVVIPLIDLCHHVVQIIETRVLEGVAFGEVSLSDRATYASLGEISDHLQKAPQSTVVAKVGEDENKVNLLLVQENVSQRDLMEKSLEKLSSDSLGETKHSDGTSEGEFKSLSDSEEVTKGIEETNKAVLEIKEGIAEKGEDIESSESAVDILGGGEPRLEKLNISGVAKEILHSAAIQETVSLHIAEEGVLTAKDDAKPIDEEMKKDTHIAEKEVLPTEDGSEKIGDGIRKETLIAGKEVFPKKDDAEKIEEDINKETHIAEKEVLPKKDDAAKTEVCTESTEKSEVHAEVEVKKKEGKSELRDKDNEEMNIHPNEVEESEPKLDDLKVTGSQKSDLQIEKEERSYKEITYSREKLNSLIQHVKELENEVSSAISLISGTKAKFSAQPILESVIIDIKSVKRVAENLLREIHLDKTRVKFISDKARFIEGDLNLVIKDILKEECLALNTAVNIVKLIRDIKLIDEESESEDEDLLEIREIKKKLEEVKKEAEQLGRKSIVSKEIDEAVESESGGKAYDAAKQEEKENEGFKESALAEGSDDVASSKKLIEEEKTSQELKSTRETDGRKVEEEGEKKIETKDIVEQQVDAKLGKAGEEKLERLIEARKGDQEEKIESKEDDERQITKKVEVDKQRERPEDEKENEEYLLTKKNTDKEKQEKQEAEDKQKDKEAKEKRRTSKQEELNEEKKIEDKVAKTKEAGKKEKKEIQEKQKLKDGEKETKKKEPDEENKKEEAEEDQKLKATEEENKKKEVEKDQKASEEENKETEVEEKQKFKDGKKENKKAEEDQKLKTVDEEKKKKEDEEVQKLKAAENERLKIEAEKKEKKDKEAEEEVELNTALEKKEKTVAEEERKLKNAAKNEKKEAEEDQKLKAEDEEKKKKETEKDQKLKPAEEERKDKKADEGQKLNAAEEEKMKKEAEGKEKKGKEAEEEVKLNSAKDEKEKKETAKKEKEVVDEKQKLNDTKEEKKMEEAQVDQKLNVAAEVEKKKEESEDQELKVTAEETMKKEAEEKKNKGKEPEEKITLKVVEGEKKTKDVEEERKLKGVEEEKRKKETEEDQKTKATEEENMKEFEEKEKKEVEEKQKLKDTKKEKKKKKAEEKEKLIATEEGQRNKEIEEDQKSKAAEEENMKMEAMEKEKEEDEEKETLKTAEEKKKKESEEALTLRNAEEENKKKEAEVDEKKQEDEVTLNLKEVEEKKKKEAEAEKKKKEAEETQKLKVAEQGKTKKDAEGEKETKETQKLIDTEAEKKKQETEAEMKKKGAEVDKKKKEADETQKVAGEENKKNESEAEETKKEAELEKKRKGAEAEKDKKKKEAEETQKLKVGEEKKKKEEADETQKLKVGEEGKKKKEADEKNNKEEEKEAEAEKKIKEAEKTQKLKNAEEKNKKRKEADGIQKVAEGEKKQKETEEENKRKEAEAEEKKKEAAAEEKKKEAEAEMKKQEAGVEKKKKEAEEKEKLKVAEEEKMKKAAEEKQKLKVAEEEKNKKAAEEKQKLKVAEEEKKKKEAEAEKKKKEAGETHNLKVAEEEKKKEEEAEAEMKKKEAEAEKKQKEDEVENKKKEAEETQKVKVAEEEKMKKAAEEKQKLKVAEEEKNKKEAEAEKMKKEAEETQKLKAAEEEKKKEEEVEAEMKKKEAEAEKKQKEAEEENKKKEAEETQKLKVAEEEKKKEEEVEAEMKKKGAEAEMKKKGAEAEKKQKEAEEEKKKKEAKETQKLKVAEEEKNKKERDEGKKKKEAEAEKKKKEAEETQLLKVAEEEKNKKERDEGKKKKEAEAEMKKKEVEAEMKKKEVEEKEKLKVAEEEKKKKAAEEKQKLKVVEEEKKKKEAEAEEKKKETEAEMKRKEAEAEMRKNEVEEKEQLKVAEEEQNKKAAKEKQELKVVEEEKRKEEAEAEKKKREAEETQKLKVAEEEKKKKEAAEAEMKKKEAEVEMKKKEAEVEKKKKEAEVEMKEKEAEENEKLKVAEEAKKKKEAEAGVKKKEAETEMKKKEAEVEKKKKEAEAEIKKKEAEGKEKLKVAEEEKKKKEAEVEKMKNETEAEKKKKCADEKNKKTEAEEEKNVNGCNDEPAERRGSLRLCEPYQNISQERNGSDDVMNHVDKKKSLKSEMEEYKDEEENVPKKTKQLLEESPADYNEETEDEMKMLYGCRIGEAKEIRFDINRKMENDIDDRSDSSDLKKETSSQGLVNDRERCSYGNSLPTLRIEEPHTNRHKLDVLPVKSPVREPSQSRRYHTDDISRGSDSLMSIRSISYDSSHREIPKDNSKLKHYLSQSYKDLCLEYSPKNYLVRDDYSEKDYSSIRVSKSSHFTARDYKYDSSSATLDSIRKKVDKSWRHLNRHLSSGHVASHSVEHLSSERGSRESLGIRKRLGSWDHLSSTEHKSRDPVTPVYIEDFSPLAQSRRYTRRRSVSPLPLLGDISLPVRQRSRSRSRFDHFEKKPYICSSLRDRRVDHGSNVKLTCNIGGEPEPTVEWLKDGQHIQSIIDRYSMEYSFGVASLEIRSVIASDNGQYTCVAVNSAGQAATTATLRVNTEQWQGLNDYAVSQDPCTLPLRVPEQGPRVTGLIADPLVPSGGVIALHLQIEGCHRAEVTWLKEGAPLPRGLRTHTLVDPVMGLHTLLVESATPAEGGLYQARILSGLGRLIEPAPAHVQVVERRPGDKPALITARPDTRLSLTAGEDLTLTCYVSGEPKPRVVLMKGIKDITDGARTLKECFGEYVRLTLKRASPQDSGTYFIVARNPYGTDRTFSTVNIRERARSLTPTRRERALSQFRESSYSSSYTPLSSPTYL